MTSNPVPDEHRLAIILDGGISLAVWMGGIAYEIENLRRASHGFAPPASATAADRAVLDLWRDHTHGQRFTVDVIGGTSAGGLNGVFLAAAIARGAPLTTLRDLWFTRAQLSAGKLIAASGDSTAVLDGDYFLGVIGESLASIVADPDSGHIAENQDDEDPAQTTPARPMPVTLITTATAVGGLPRERVDSFGTHFTQADHRRRFRFRRQPDALKFTPNIDAAGTFTEVAGPNDFEARPSIPTTATSSQPADPTALAQAGRATASVPVGFPAVRESAALRAQRVWPTWETGPRDDREWLIDGGVLDNSPYQPVLDEITKQSVSATWKRTVCSIVTSAQEPDLSGPTAEPKPSPSDPPPWTTAGIALATFPGEIDFRDDMELLQAQLLSGRVDRDIERFEQLAADPDARASLVATAEQLMPYYRASRASAAIAEVTALLAASTNGVALQPTVPVDVDEVLATDRDWIPSALPTTVGEEWKWGVSAAERLLRLWLRALREKTGPGDVPGTFPEARRAIDTAIHKIVVLRHALNEQLVENLGGVDATVRPSVVTLANGLTISFGTLGLAPTLTETIWSAADTMASVLPGAAIDFVQAGLTLEVVDGAPGLPTTYRPTPIFDYKRIGIPAMPKILGGGDPNSNVPYGTQLGHFAAFGSPEWRKWDWMWGRIQAATQLADLLEIDARERSTLIDELVEAIIVSEGRTVQEVIDALASPESPLQLDAAKTKALLFSNGSAQDALTAIFRLLTSKTPTSPEVPPALKGIGAVANALLARQPAPIQHLLLRMVRAILLRWRRRIWRGDVP